MGASPPGLGEFSNLGAMTLVDRPGPHTPGSSYCEVRRVQGVFHHHAAARRYPRKNRTARPAAIQRQLPACCVGSHAGTCVRPALNPRRRGATVAVAMELVLLMLLACAREAEPLTEPRLRPPVLAAESVRQDPQSCYDTLRAHLEGPEAAGECGTDAQCQSAGCSSEVCVAAVTATDLMTTCEAVPCLDALVDCTCQATRCRWTLSPSEAPPRSPPGPPAGPR
jgi:hypothetical protein